MNPPFGKCTASSDSILRDLYPDTWKDIYAAFLERALVITNGGHVGCISSSLFLYSKQLNRLREIWSTSKNLACLVELGSGVLDSAAVETALTISTDVESDPTWFLDLTAASKKHEELWSECKGLLPSVRWRRLESFARLYGSPFAYHVPLDQLALWSVDERLDPDIASVVAGNTTFDNDRFLRLWTEVEATQLRVAWTPYEKGGEYQPFSSPAHLVYLWGRDGHEARTHQIVRSGTDAQTIQSITYWFRPGLTYPRVSSIGFAPRAMPGGEIFSTEAMSIFCHNTDDLLPLLALLCSTWTQDLLNAFGRYRKIENRAVSNLPFSVDLLAAHRSELQEYALRGVQIVQDLESTDEVSPLFVSPEPLIMEHSPVERLSRRKLVNSLASLYKELDEFVGKMLFGRKTHFGEPLSVPRSELCNHFAFRDLQDSSQSVVLESIMYLVGTIYGRWDVEFATGSRSRPELPDPFAPLPICPPGMLQNAHGLPAAPADVPADYPLRISWPGILVDDPGHPEDIEARVRDTLRVIWPASADAIEQEACQILGVGSLREYFASPGRFFDDHLKRYSKSRRAAPIYWPLSTASGSYTLWLYYHRLSDQTLYWCVNDFVEPRLRVTGDRLTVIRRKANRSREEERELERLSQFEAELREFRDELLRVAAWWRPNLNDGVQITAAPLWRLFGHRQLRQRLRETWEQLEAGDYDWAHLALSIWPARVVPKCVTDRSLAIAHDLEDLFWVEDPPGSWRNLRSTDEEIEGLVAAQQSPARERLAVLLAELARGRGRGLRCAEVWDELAAGRWDDLEAALLLWPERVAERCWDDPLLAVTLQINLPTKRTKAARERFVKERVAAGCPDLAAALEAALRERPDRFSAFWSELARGDPDHLRLALALWPARVVEKCAVDVELAAGHEVRRFLWVRGRDVWQRRKASQDELERAIARIQLKGT